MSKNALIMGIETSCDETAAAIIQDDSSGIPKILSNIVSSQFDVHKKFGGVVPDLAARAHVEKIDLIVKEALMKSKKSLNDIDAVAATAGPGLIVCLSVGLNFAKALSLSLNKPFIGVNHLEGHALSPKLQTKLDYPYLLLLISGGHSQFLCVNGLGDYKRLGTTIDDALGEAFDKTARLLNIGYPGGPQIEKCAGKGNPDKYQFPMPLIHEKNCNFSFSGLKSVGGWKRFDQGGMLLVNVGQNVVRAFNSSCPHAGCRTSWGYSNNNFRCGCHGATFNNQGSVLSAPGGTGDLISFTAVLEDDVLTVSK